MKTLVKIVAGICLAGAGMAWGQYVETIVPTGDSPGDLIWSRVWNKIYCSNTQDASITVISGESNQVLATIQVGDYPGYLCLNADESKLYCTRTEDENRLVIIDVAADTVLKTLSIQNRPGPMAYSATMAKLYIACNDDPVYRIVVLDATADTVLRYITARDVGRLLWHPLSNRVFSCGADTIRVLDCVTDEIVVRLRGGGTYWCRSPLNDFVYLSARDTIHVYSPGGDSEVAAVPGRAGAALIAMPCPSKVLAVGGGPGGTVIRIIDGENHTVLDSVFVGGGGISLVGDAARSRVYCSNTNARKVDVIDARADTLIKTILLGRSPGATCWNRTYCRAYIADFMDNVVYVIRDTTTGIAETRPVCSTLPRRSTILKQVLVWRGPAPGELLDVAGRRVAGLRPGRNDLAHLALGVYMELAPGGEEARRIVKVE